MWILLASSCTCFALSVQLETKHRSVKIALISPLKLDYVQVNAVCGVSNEL